MHTAESGCPAKKCWLPGCRGPAARTLQGAGRGGRQRRGMLAHVVLKPLQQMRTRARRWACVPTAHANGGCALATRAAVHPCAPTHSSPVGSLRWLSSCTRLLAYRVDAKDGHTCNRSCRGGSPASTSAAFASTSAASSDSVLSGFGGSPRVPVRAFMGVETSLSACGVGGWVEGPVGAADGARPRGAARQQQWL